MIKAGIIGCGNIAKIRHIPEYANHPDVVIAGYYDQTTEKAEEQAALYGGTVYKTIDELLNDKTINVVSVCLANAAHAEVTIQALHAGKHVLCEKPMATNIEDCIRMVETAEKQNRFLMIAHNQRFSQSHQLAKKLLEDGLIGRPLTFHTAFGHCGPENLGISSDKPVWFFDKKQAGMGVTADLGIHKIDLMQYLLNQSPIDLIVRTATLDKKDASGAPITVEDNAFCILQMSQGTIGTMAVSWTYYGEEENFTIIYGTKGIMKVPGPWDERVLVITSNGEEYQYDVKEKCMDNGMVNSGVIDEFIDAIINNRQPLSSGKEVLASMKLIFSGACYENKRKSDRFGHFTRHRSACPNCDRFEEE